MLHKHINSLKFTTLSNKASKLTKEIQMISKIKLKKVLHDKLSELE